MADVNNFDPSIAIRSESQVFSPLAYENLLGFQSGPDTGFMDLVLKPRLAESWEVSADARSYTFHLRKGVRFNGIDRDFNSGDVKFSYEYHGRTGDYGGQKLPAGTFNFMLEGLEGIDTPDASTAVVRFKEGFVPFLNYSASFRIPIMPREIFDRDGHLKDAIAGTGPFQLDQAASQRGSQFTWKKNANYWGLRQAQGEGGPYLDEVRTLVIADLNAQQAAFITKQLDYLTTTSVNSANDLKKAAPDANVNEHFLANGIHLWMTERPGDLFNNALVRKAFGLAIDRDEFVRTFSGGKAEWSLAGAFTGFFKEAEVKQVLKYDPEEAKRLLAQAGYANGVDVNYLLSRDAGEVMTSKAQLLQSQVKKVGMNIKFQIASESEVGLKRRFADGWDLAPSNRASDSDVDSYVYAVFHSKASNNLGKVNDPGIDRLVEAQRRELDPAKRRERVREAARYIADNALGWSLPYEPEYAFTQSYVRGFVPNFGTGNVIGPVAQAWLAK
jgi:peptide/nickel transport system substrate-binding protein